VARWFDIALFTGVGIGGVVMVIMLIHALVVRPAIVRYLEGYTQLAPKSMPKVEMDETEFEDLDERVDTFAENVETGAAASDLMLTDRELNALIQDQTDSDEADYRIHFENGLVRADLSFRLEPEYAVGYLRGLAGRYVSGTAWFDARLRDGQFSLELERFVLGGREVPDWIIGVFGRDNIEKRLLADEDVVAVIESLESMEILDGEVILRPKSRLQQDSS